MSRSTQYVGLTKDAEQWLKKSSIGCQTFPMSKGMFEEDVTGVIHELPAPVGCKAYIAKEKVQVAPWSCGPMIFTCLELIQIRESGQVVSLGEIFQWVCNPDVRGEYDPVKGHYWV